MNWQTFVNKSAIKPGTHVSNLSYKEIISSLTKEYKTIDFPFKQY